MKRLILLLCLVGCSEYAIHDPNQVAPQIPNWQQLENDFVVDEFKHPTPAPADILVAVDKSCSMSNNRAEWLSNMPVFVQVLEDNYIDYHLGVISTDNSNVDTVGQLPWWGGVQWASRYDVSPTATFTALEAAASGYSEMGLDAVRGALVLRPNDGNEGFLRQNVPLHIITISDEPDQSTHTGPGKMLSALNDYRIQNNSIVSYSVIVHTPNSQVLGCAVSEPMWGHGYLEVARDWQNGRIIDICEPDWSQPIQDIADYIGQNVTYEYFLREVPVPETLEVFVIEDGVTFIFVNVEDYDESIHLPIRGYERTWYFDQKRNSIVFPDFVPEYETQVRVEYYSAEVYKAPEDTGL
ncbi:MAG: hypothetical protein ACXABY_04980 [Candidatus Thorarchaeota archaeon]